MSRESMVDQFHAAFDYMTPTPDHVTISDDATNGLRIKLLREELDELSMALENRDPVESIDALCDLQYVLSGAVLALGFNPGFEAAFNAVHQSNMEKLWKSDEVESAQKSGSELIFKKSSVPNRWIASRADGKIIKPPSWKKPDLAKFVK